MFQKDTPFVIGVDHIDLAFALGVSGCRFKTLGTNDGHTEIDADMAAHFCYKINFVGLQHNFPVLLAAGAALAARRKNRP